MFVSQSKYEKLEKEYRVSRDECRDAKLKASSLEAENATLTEQITALQGQVEAKTKEYNALLTQVTMVCKQYKLMKAGIKELSDATTDKTVELKVESLLNQIHIS